MKTNFSKINVIILFVFASITFITHAENSSSAEFDAQRPAEMSDKVWASLRNTVQTAKLLPTPVGVGGQDTYFGNSVSVQGDRALISAPFYADSGVVFVYDYDSMTNQWNKTIELVGADSEAGDQFGWSVSLQGNRALIGAPYTRKNSTTGAAYIFDFDGSSWSQTQKLFADDAFSGDRFGYSVSLGIDRALIGAYLNDDTAPDFGSAYVFDLSLGVWNQTQKLLASDAASGDRFGYSVSLYQDRALIGAYLNDDTAPDSGSAYVFDLNAGSWSQTTKLLASDIANNAYFGFSVDLGEDRLVIGARNSNVQGVNGAGSVYVFDFSSNTWSETQILSASDKAIDDDFGYSVSLHQDRILIGSYNDDDGGLNSGSGYVFDLDLGTWNQTQKLIADDDLLDDRFGSSVSLNGDRLLVGAFLDDDANINEGSAYMFDLGANIWSQSQKITINNTGAAKDYFGYSVSISGQRALIGAHGDDDIAVDAGTAYVFDFIDNQWQLSQKLFASDAGNSDLFGFSVDLSGDRALIGAIREDQSAGDSGAVYVFDYNGTNWVQTQKLKASDADTNDHFGHSVSLEGDRFLVGSRFNDDNVSNSGSAYIFDYDGSQWTETQKLLASNAAFGDEFGHSVSLSFDRALIGAYRTDEKGFDSGSAYIFDYDGSQWTETQKLTANDGANGDRFGFSLSLLGNRAVIGAHGDDRGSAYVYDYDGSQWLLSQNIIPQEVAGGFFFGYSVSQSENHILIGAILDNIINIESGAAYLFEKTGSSWIQQESFRDAEGSRGDQFGYSVSINNDFALIGARFDGDRGWDAGSAFVYDVNPKYTVAGDITGLDGSGLRLILNDAEIININVNGSFIFPTALLDGSSYEVKVDQQPINNNQVCIVSNGSGVSEALNIQNISVQCTTQMYTIAVDVSGIVAGNFVTITNNQSDLIQVNQDGIALFNTPILDGSGYDVNVSINPSQPSQTCEVENGMGTVQGQDVTLNVMCSINEYTVGVNVTDLMPNTTLELLNNGQDYLEINTNGMANFTQKLPDQSSYNITVLTQPSQPSQNCVVINGSDTIASDDVVINVSCTVNQYPIGVNVSGLSNGSTLSLSNDSETLNVTANGVTNFSTQLNDLTAFDVSVLAQPTFPNQLCEFTSINTGNVNNSPVMISIACTTLTYSVSVQTSGLAEGAELVLDGNAGSITIVSDGLQNFPTALEDQSLYGVLMTAQPTSPNQNCIFVSVPTGIIMGSDVIIDILCWTIQYEVQVSVVGLLNGSELTVSNINESITIDLDGTYSFPTPLDDYSNYSVTVTNQPNNPSQECVFVQENQTGSLDGQNILIPIVCSIKQYNIDVNVTGLDDSNSVSFSNGSDTVTILSDGLMTLSRLDDESSYNVDIVQQPETPNQVCSFLNGDEGAISGADIQIEVQCVTTQNSLNINVTGLAQSNTVSFSNGEDTLDVNLDGLFTLSTLEDGDNYEVNITSQPDSPNQTCSFDGANSGVFSDSGVQIDVSCVTTKYDLNINVSGLAEGNFVNFVNGSDALIFTTDGTQRISMIDDGSFYDVNIIQQPITPNQTCEFINSNTGMVESNHVQIDVICTINHYLVSVNVDGLASENFVSFLNNGIDYLQVSSNGLTGFTSTYADGTGYSLSLLKQPVSPNQTCSFTNNFSGDISAADVQVEVSCITNAYFIGGTVYGLLEDNYLVLNNNNTDEETITSNGSYVFDTPLLDQIEYDVSIDLQPDNPIQTCALRNNHSTIAGSDVVNVDVECLIGDDLIFTQGFEVLEGF